MYISRGLLQSGDMQGMDDDGSEPHMYAVHIRRRASKRQDGVVESGWLDNINAFVSELAGDAGCLTPN